MGQGQDCNRALGYHSRRILGEATLDIVKQAWAGAEGDMNSDEHFLQEDIEAIIRSILVVDPVR